MSAVAGTSCSTPAECNDGNSCTDDVCSGGSCSNTPDNTNACSDGVACTSDACSGGTCVATPNCPVGQTCNLQTGICAGSAVTLGFQQGVAGYTGTQDTYLLQAAPGTASGGATSWRWDQDNPVDSNNDEVGLIRFDGIFGPAANQIPVGSTIQSATLTLNVTNGSVAPAGEVRPSLEDWTAATATWTNFGGDAGVQTDEYGAAVAAAPLPTGLAGDLGDGQPPGLVHEPRRQLRLGVPPRQPGRHPG